MNAPLVLGGDGRLAAWPLRVVANNQCAAVAASNGKEGWKVATAVSYNLQEAQQLARQTTAAA